MVNQGDFYTVLWHGNLK